MIPKIIHYCWFGKSMIPEKYQRFIEGWRTIMPDYELKLWNEANSPMHLPYMQTAYKTKRWANLSNFARLYAVYQEGGIYLDTDVEVLKRFDSLLEYGCFFGFETGKTNKKLVVNNAIFGAEPGHPFIRKCKVNLLATFPGSEPSNLSAPGLITQTLIKEGLKSYGNQRIQDVVLLEQDFLYPYGWKENFTKEQITPNTLAVHHWDRSWWAQSVNNKGVSRDLQQKKTTKSSIRTLLSVFKHYGFPGVELVRRQVVQYGPFQGMRYFGGKTRKSEFLAKLIGCYNEIIHPAIYDLMDCPYNRIVVAGCADGYYTTGFAKIFPNSEILTISTQPDKSRSIRRMAEKNRVVSMVTLIEDPGDLSWLKIEKNKRGLFFCDSGSLSSKLLTPESIPCLSHFDLLIQLPARDEVPERIRLLQLFKPTHDSEIFEQGVLPVTVLQFLNNNSSGQKIIRLIDADRFQKRDWVRFVRRRP